MTRDQSPAAVGRTLAFLLRHSAVRYLIIGSTSFLIDIGLLALFYQVLGWQLWLATGSAFLLTFAFNYSFQRAYSFGSKAGHGRTLLKYLVLLGVNTLATIGIVWVVDQTALGWGVGSSVQVRASTPVGFSQSQACMLGLQKGCSHHRRSAC